MYPVCPREKECSEHLGAGEKDAGGIDKNTPSLGRVFLPVAEQAPSRVPQSWPCCLAKAVSRANIIAVTLLYIFY